MYKRFFYISINSLILGIAVILFVREYTTNVQFPSLVPLLYMAGMVLGVHICKATRLYVALYGAPITLLAFLKTYCKVTPVSIVFPFKLGELFRMYCYGYLIQDYLKGCIIILLDRFMDTCALLTYMIVLYKYTGQTLPVLVYLLSFLVLILLGTYGIFPGLYQFWKTYYLKTPATRNTLWILKQLDYSHNLFKQVSQILKGRGLILYILSLIAWGIELANLTFFAYTVSGQSNLSSLSNYLSAALSNAPYAGLQLFVVVSVGLLLISYILLQVIPYFHKTSHAKSEGLFV